MTKLLWVLLLSGCATWTPRDRALGVTMTVAVAADVGTTLHRVGKPNMIERNPLLGPYPPAAAVVSLATVGLAGAWFVADVLPRKVRPWWLGTVAVICFANALHNSAQ